MTRLYPDTDEAAEELQILCEEYFGNCIEQEKPVGFAGLAYHLGFSYRQSLNEYADRDDKTSLPIKRAMLYIEADYEAQLRSNSCTGAIFALKNRGWVDKSEQLHKTIDGQGKEKGIEIVVSKAGS